MTERKTTFDNEPLGATGAEEAEIVDPEEERKRALLDSHATLAREGLERVFLLHPELTRREVEETHQIITTAHLDALPKLGRQRVHPEDI
jgi:hypothetical protein